MGSLCKTPEPTPVPTTTTQSNEIPTWISQPASRNISAAEQIARQPYQTYEGPRLAGFSPLQQQAFQQTGQMMGQWQPGLAAAFGSTAIGAQSLPQYGLQQYINPYQQNVTDIGLREAARQSAIQQQGIGASAAKVGAFGGARHGIAESEERRQLGQRLADIQAAGSSAAFQQATGAAQADLARQLAAGKQFADLSTAGQTLGLRDVALAQEQGGIQQAQGQKELDIPYGEFVQQRDYPKEQAGWLASVIRGTPYSASQTMQGQQWTPQSSPLAAAAGLGITGLGLYGAYKGLGTLLGGQG